MTSSINAAGIGGLGACLGFSKASSNRSEREEEGLEMAPSLMDRLEQSEQFLDLADVHKKRGRSSMRK